MRYVRNAEIVVLITAVSHVNVKNQNVMQTYAISAKNVCAAANAGAVKSLLTPVIRIAQHATELSVLIAINAAYAIRTAVALQVRVDAILDVVLIVIAMTRHVHAINASIEHAPVHRIMALTRKPLG